MTTKCHLSVSALVGLLCIASGCTRKITHHGEDNLHEAIKEHDDAGNSKSYWQKVPT